MASISQKGLTPDAHEPSGALKVAWGVVNGLVSWIMNQPWRDASFFRNCVYCGARQVMLGVMFPSKGDQ
jgi:hypothetical protein